jgi:transposase
MKSYRKVAKQTGISKSTIHRWVANIGKRTKHKPITRKRKRKLDIYKGQIISHMEANPLARIYDIQKLVYISASRSSICRFISSNNFLWKRIKPGKLNVASHMQIQTFQNTIKTVDYNDILCIDETSIHSHMLPLYGYFRKGTSANLKTYRRKGKKSLTLLCAISVNGVVAWKIIEGSCNSTIFAQFIEQFHSKHLILDNVSFHKTKDCLKVMNDNSNVALFIPPYSPQYNPIEEFFSQLKSRIRKMFSLQEEPSMAVMKHILNDTVLSFSNSNMLQYYKRSFSS